MEQIGPYKILRRITTEGSGEIYEALNEQIQRRAAIKILRTELAEDPEAIARFVNEARIVGLINHPGLVNIYETGQLATGSPYIVMEYLQGEILRDRLRRIGGRMDAKTTMRIGRQVASALAAAHAKQAVHRDIKPANIMLIIDADTPDGERVKLLNFGIAKLTTASTTSLLTKPGIWLGTPTYMSPEQCENAHAVTDRSDVYALGIMLYELLSGAPPFNDAAGPTLVMMAHLRQDPPPLANRAPDASPDLCALVHQMLAKPSAGRPTAAEVASILASLGGGKNSAAFPSLRIAEMAAAQADSPTRMLPPPPPPTEDEATPVMQLLRNPKGRLIALCAVLAFSLGLLGSVAALRSAFSGSDLPPPVSWIVISEPADAEVTDKTGQVLGHTPWQLSQPSGHGLYTLTLRKKGYREETVVLDRARDGQSKVALTALLPDPPIAPTPPAPQPEVRRKPKRSHHKSAQSKRSAR